MHKSSNERLQCLVSSDVLQRFPLPLKSLFSMSSDSIKYFTLTEEVSHWNDYSIQQAINNATNIEYAYEYDSRRPGFAPPSEDLPQRNNTIVLFDSGCYQGNRWNCTAACLDEEQGPGITWSGQNASYTIQNCLAYPIIANAAVQ